MTLRLILAAVFSGVLLVGGSAALAQDQSARPAFALAEVGDAEVNAAAKAAQDSLPIFWSQYEKRLPSDGPFLLKVGLPTRDDSVEHIWMLVTAREPKITGSLVNKPINIKGLSQGSRITVSAQQVTDWTYVRGGVSWGQFTTRVFAKRMSPESRAALMAGLSATPIEGKTP